MCSCLLLSPTASTHLTCIVAFHGAPISASKVRAVWVHPTDLCQIRQNVVRPCSGSEGIGQRRHIARHGQILRHTPRHHTRTASGRHCAGLHIPVHVPPCAQQRGLGHSKSLQVPGMWSRLNSAGPNVKKGAPAGLCTFEVVPTQLIRGAPESVGYISPSMPVSTIVAGPFSVLAPVCPRPNRHASRR